MGRSAPRPVQSASRQRQRPSRHARRTRPRHRDACRPGRYSQRPLRQSPALHYRGFCIQGCKVNAKASPLITHIPDALAHGAEVRPDSHVSRVLVDDRAGRATGVEYLHAGVAYRQRARAVVVAGYSIETPRLLLLSATSRYPVGLGNEHDQLGRYLMVQGAPQVAGRFGDEIRMYKAPPPEVSSEQFYETDPARPTGAGSQSRRSARFRLPGRNTLPHRATGA
jgi:choline dehydrogenase-like flavoprotein